VADQIGARSVAFPAISTGAYGYPLVAAAEVAVAALGAASTDVDLAILVAFDRDTEAVYRRVLRR
jgi:O-acetyl-ADP-ribose deacetylase